MPWCSRPWSSHFHTKAVNGEGIGLIFKKHNDNIGNDNFNRAQKVQHKLIPVIFIIFYTQLFQTCVYKSFDHAVCFLSILLFNILICH